MCSAADKENLFIFYVVGSSALKARFFSTLQCVFKMTSSPLLCSLPLFHSLKATAFVSFLSPLNYIASHQMINDKWRVDLSVQLFQVDMS